MIVRIMPNVKIKKEENTGKIFNRKTGDIIEIDSQCYTVMKMIQDVEIVDTKHILEIYPKIQKDKIEKVLNELIELEVLQKMPDGILTKECIEKIEQNRKSNQTTSNSIDVVHFAVTFKCNNNCPDCYMKRHNSKFNHELDIKQIEKVLDKIENAGVFALAIGGGEPFLRQDLKDILKLSYERNLVNYVTTGMYDISENTISKIAPYIKVLQIGIRINGNEKIEDTEKLIKLVNVLNKSNITYGANLVLNKTVMNGIEKVIEKILKIGFKNITLIRYKPPRNVKRWMSEVPSEFDFSMFEYKIKDLISKNDNVKFRFDCGLSFIQRKIATDVATKNGYKGCNAGKNIISIAPDGSVFPCSQLVSEQLKTGNLLEQSFDEIYNNKVLETYRNFRKTKSFKNSKCGKCTYKESCGDCRVLAQNSMNQEIGCYDPIYPQKDIQKLLEKYAEEDFYDPIGYTSGGAPFVTREQWQEWEDEWTLKNYPKWLLKNEEGDEIK